MKRISSSVIICTRNRIAGIVTCLQSLIQQTEQADEIIVVDSSDQPLQELLKFTGIFSQKFFPTTTLIYKHTTPGLAYQRNVAITLASKKIVHFLGDDLILSPDYIAQMNATFADHPKYAGGMGMVANMPLPVRRNLGWLFLKVFLLQRGGASGNFTASGMPTYLCGYDGFKTVQVLGCCMSYRLAIFAKHRFDEKLQRYGLLQDSDFSRRVAYDAPLFYNGAAKFEHHPSVSGCDGIVDNRAMYIKNYSYLFFKNFYPRNRLKIVAYAWSVIGLFLQAVGGRRGNEIRGYCRGLKEFYGNKKVKKMGA